MGFEDTAIADELKDLEGSEELGRSPLIKSKTRSLSDGGGTPVKLSPSPHILDAGRRTSKDDSNLKEPTSFSTPQRPEYSTSGLALQLPRRQFTPPVPGSGAFAKPAPLSPQLDNSQIYASPTNILPRRSRGLDFSRAATSLHHSTLAESSPDSSPVMGGRAMNIPGRRADFGAGPEHSSTSLWSIMGNQERMNLSNSLGSAHAVGSDSSSSADDDDLMDEDMDDNFITTPSVSKTTSVLTHAPPGAPFGSPAIGSLINFQQRQRHRKSLKQKHRPVGFNSGGSSISNSPPNNAVSNTRRESISWQANQLHISGVDSEDNTRASSEADALSSDGQRNVVRRAVTRRGNLLPKPKTFARIRAALFEEGAPAEAEFKREAEVVKQVRDSDAPEPRRPQSVPPSDTPAPATALSSPNQESLDDIPEDDMMELAAGLSSSFKQHAMRNSKGKMFWETFSDTSSIGGTRTTPPPQGTAPRGSSSGVSDDVGMDSPLQGGSSVFPSWNNPARGDSQRSDTDRGLISQPQPPSAAEITRRINNKRRRDDDFDPNAFKRRAVSPGLSVHNSPIAQSPMQRDLASWGSRPGSKGGEKAGSSAPSESGSANGNNQPGSGNPKGRLGSKARVGFQGMFDTNDGIMRMSIE